MPKFTINLLSTMGLIVLFCAGCTPSTLTNSGGEELPNSRSGGAVSGNAIRFSLPQQPPPINGSWHITSQNCLATFSQEGTKLMGSGNEGPAEDGRGPFILENGKLEGMKVYFDQKFTGDPSKRPIGHSGYLSFHYSPRYKGWMMEGQKDWNHGPLLAGATCNYWYAWKGIDDFDWAGNGHLFTTLSYPSEQIHCQAADPGERIFIPKQPPLLSWSRCGNVFRLHGRSGDSRCYEAIVRR